VVAAEPRAADTERVHAEPHELARVAHFHYGLTKAVYERHGVDAERTQCSGDTTELPVRSSVEVVAPNAPVELDDV